MSPELQGRQGRAGGDSLGVASDAVGEGVRPGPRHGADEPVFEGEQAVAARHDAGEAADVGCRGFQVRAAVPDGGEPCLVAAVRRVSGQRVTWRVFGADGAANPAASA